MGKHLESLPLLIGWIQWWKPVVITWDPHFRVLATRQHTPASCDGLYRQRTDGSCFFAQHLSSSWTDWHDLAKTSIPTKGVEKHARKWKVLSAYQRWTPLAPSPWVEELLLNGVRLVCPGSSRYPMDQKGLSVSLRGYGWGTGSLGGQFCIRCTPALLALSRTTNWRRPSGQRPS